MAYTPELNQRDSGTLRRIAWALDVPMTTALERVMEHIGATLDNQKVCDSCKDSSFCGDCTFHQ